MLATQEQCWLPPMLLSTAARVLQWPAHPTRMEAMFQVAAHAVLGIQDLLQFLQTLLSTQARAWL